MDSEVSPQLLTNIFIPNTPLHDGAFSIPKYLVNLLVPSCSSPLLISGWNITTSANRGKNMLNNLIYGTNGTLAKVLSKDEVNNTLNVVPVSLSVAIGSNDVYLTSEKINPKINSQTTL